MVNQEKYSQFKTMVESIPSDDFIFVGSDGIKRLEIDFILDKLNEIYGKGNWHFKTEKKFEENLNAEVQIGTLNVLLPYSHEETWLSRAGICAISKSFSEEEAKHDALRNAVASLGNIFGRKLKEQFEK